VWAYFKQGWNEVPFLYAGFALGFAGISIATIRILRWPTGGYVTRYKERYMGLNYSSLYLFFILTYFYFILVMRPQDERLVGYPKEYVTDNHLLK
jgi:hypothetical protein